MRLPSKGNVGDWIAVGGNLYYPGYIVKGREKRLMIDAGINLMGPAYIASLEQIFGDRHALNYVFATHSHFDHLGAIPYLKRKLPGLKAGAAARVGSLMKKESVLNLMAALSEHERDALRDIVGEEDVRLEAVDFELNLKEGDRFDLGGVTCEVYEVPGHTADSLAFFIPEIGALFAAEACGIPEGNEDSDVHVQFLSSYDDYVASLEKIIRLQPKILGMAHSWIFTGEDAKAFLQRSLDAAPRYRMLIETYLDAANNDIDAAIQTVAKKEYDEKGTIVQIRAPYLQNLTAQVRHIASLKDPAGC